MTVPRRTLPAGEEVVADLRPHWKTLVLPAIALPVIVGLGSFGIFSIPPGSLHRAGQYAVLVAALLALGWLSLRPYLRWRGTSYVLTNRRLLVRSGVLARRGRDLPLQRVADVSFSHTLLERLLRTGTLVVESGGEQGQLRLPDVPQVADLQRELYRLAEEDDRRRRRFGNDVGEPGYADRY